MKLSFCSGNDSYKVPLKYYILYKMLETSCLKYFMHVLAHMTVIFWAKLQLVKMGKMVNFLLVLLCQGRPKEDPRDLFWGKEIS